MNLTQEKFYQKYAWVLLFVLGILLSLTSLFIVISGGFDMSDFEMSTGVVWDEFTDLQPEVAAYVVRLLRLSGVGFAGFALFAAALAWTGYRRGKRDAWYIMWLFPIILGGTAIVFFTADAAGLGAYYGGAAVIALLGLFLPYRKFFPEK